MPSTELKQVLLKLAAAAGRLTVAGCGSPVPLSGCETSTDLHVLCDLTKPEDLAAVAGTPWVLISELGNTEVAGGIAAYRPADGKQSFARVRQLRRHHAYHRHHR